MIEVEIRARVSNPEKIKKILKDLNATFVGSNHQIDKIFGHPMFLDKDKMIIEGGIVPRIRFTNNKAILEFKEICRKGGGMEIKSELTNINFGGDFLNRLGFSEAFTIDKQRESYKYNNFNIELDEVDQLGTFIEIEKMVNLPDEKQSAREDCINCLNLIYPEGIIEDKKYGDLMQELINQGKK